MPHLVGLIKPQEPLDDLSQPNIVSTQYRIAVFLGGRGRVTLSPITIASESNDGSASHSSPR